MLYPIRNAYRQTLDLSGFWEFQIDPDDIGVQKSWQTGLPQPRPIAVPASWNDQFENLRDFLGPAWYQTTFDLPWGWGDQGIFLRFNSINYLAEVWLNGKRVGSHEGGHLPFSFDITKLIRPALNQLVVQVDGRLGFDRVPPGNVTGTELDFFSSHNANYPQTQFDFFPFCGIHRPVLLYIQPKGGLDDITVITDLEGNNGLLSVSVQPCEADIRVSLTDRGKTRSDTGIGEVHLEVPQPCLWSPDSPFLYDLTIDLLDGQQTLDSYTLPVGIRTIEVAGAKLLLNSQPIYLRGFGRHEDFPISGRGINPPVIIKDYALMKWIGANSFRTSHYPYSEEMLALADRLGFLVIDETPAVGLFFNDDCNDRRLALCKQYTQEMIQRDKNHPSVIAWSLANEPHSIRGEAKIFFRALYDFALTLDVTRPITLASFMATAEESFEFLDLLCLNRYWGWYQESGQIERGVQLLSAELDMLYQRFHKPLIMTEFGADAIPGQHALPPEMFSEEYQADLLAATIRVLRSKTFVVGEHVWNMCDFKTSQGVIRMGGYNYKGVFTRDRRPKMAAHRLRDLWTQESERE